MPSDEPETGERKLFGAALAASQRKQSVNTLDAFLNQLSTGLDEKIQEAKEQVENLQNQTEIAKRNLRTLEAIRAVQKGEFRLEAPMPTQTAKRASSGPRAPRAEGAAIRDKIMEVLKAADSDGLPVADLLPKVTSGDDKAKQAVRNQLSAMVKKSLLGYSNGFYQLVA